MPSEMTLKQYHLAYRASKWVRNHFTYLGQVMLITMLFAAAFGIDTTATTTYQLIVLLLVLLVFAFLNSCFMQLELSATRRLPRYFTVGEKAFYSILLDNKINLSFNYLALIELLLGTPPDASELV